MPFATSGKNNMLNAIGTTHASLHSNVPSDSGNNEISGGSPAYARKAISLAAASGGSRAFSSAPVIDVPAGTTIYFLGMWDAVTAGNFLGFMPVNGGTVHSGACVVASTDLVEAVAHGLTTDDRVSFVTLSGDAIPTGLLTSVVYFVLASGLTADAFKVSLTSGGAAIDITTDGECVFQKVIPSTYAVQGTYTVTSGSFDLNG